MAWGERGVPGSIPANVGFCKAKVNYREWSPIQLFWTAKTIHIDSRQLFYCSVFISFHNPLLLIGERGDYSDTVES